MATPTDVDPVAAVWGFHLHQDLTEATSSSHFARTLACQHAASRFLEAHGIQCDVVAAFRPGYGPHFSNAWEIRVETSLRPFTLTYYGMALLWQAFNHHGIGTYVHPTMHDESQPGVVQLRDEGVHHTNHTVFFGPTAVTLKLDFFFDPPMTAEGRIADTRNPHLISAEEVDSEMKEFYTRNIDMFVDPFVGERFTSVEVRVVAASEAVVADFEELLAACFAYLTAKDVVHRVLRGRDGDVAIVFDAVEAERQPMNASSSPCEVKGLTAAQQAVCRGVGTCVAWLFCNRLARGEAKQRRSRTGVVEPAGAGGNNDLASFVRVTGVVKLNSALAAPHSQFYLGVDGRREIAAPSASD